MKYSIFNYDPLPHSRFVNIGDYIQSLAAEQYLPRTDFFTKRDHLNTSNFITEPTKIIMNGWFTHKPENWPPVQEIIPLFVSFHLNPHHSRVLLEKRDTIEYLQKYSPIGCRDYTTVRLLEEAGIKAYYSSCLTTTLDLKYKSLEKNDSIVFCDVMYSLVGQNQNGAIASLKGKIKQMIKSIRYNYLNKKLFPKNIRKQAVYVTHNVAVGLSDIEYFEQAKQLLHLYSTAKLVVTSRIHCALPCLALGTPVLFVPDGISSKISEYSRLIGIIEHLNILTLLPQKKLRNKLGDEVRIFTPRDIDWNSPNENPDSYKIYSDQLKKICYSFVKE